MLEYDYCCLISCVFTIILMSHKKKENDARLLSHIVIFPKWATWSRKPGVHFGNPNQDHWSSLERFSLYGWARWRCWLVESVGLWLGSLECTPVKPKFVKQTGRHLVNRKPKPQKVNPKPEAKFSHFEKSFKVDN